jgi:hypothetical protein
MSRKMLSTPLWLRGDCSNRALSTCSLAVVSSDSVEHLLSKNNNSFKYFQFKFPEHKHMKIASLERTELVSKRMFVRSKLNDY